MSKGTRYESACGSIGRVVAARIFPNQDVIKTLGDICLENEIKYGQITTTIGSLKRINLHYVSRLKPIKNLGHTSHLTMDAPFSVLSGQGLVSPSEDQNKMNVHYHAVVSGKNDVVYGGHIEEGTITLSTMDIFITEVLDIEISRKKDPETGIVFTSFEETNNTKRLLS